MTPQFLECDAERLFCLHFEPPAARAITRRVLLIPPFAEELNKCRRLLAATARALAAAGCAVLWPDLDGTGDSSGEFAAAEWSRWAAQLVHCARWLERSAPAAAPAYLAVRSGALLLGQSLAQLREAMPARVVLWQPVLDGNRFLQQFLRLRVMSERLAGGTLSMEDMQQRLRAGTGVEVGGYLLSPSLAAALAAATLDGDAFAAAERVALLEFKSGPGAALSVPSERLAARLATLGVAVQSRVVDCEQFWTTQEISAPPAAGIATVECFGG